MMFLTTNFELKNVKDLYNLNCKYNHAWSKLHTFTEPTFAGMVVTLDVRQ